MKLTLTPLVASTFLSDGGTMFGMVPKALWSKLMQPDEKNRIHQNLNTLLIDWEDGRRALLDLGCGSADKFTEKERQINGVQDWPLLSALENLDVAPESITDIFLTHLHWDHAGGALHPDGSAVFPNATLHVHQAEWEDAHSGSPLFYKAYPSAVVNPLDDAYTVKQYTDDDACELPGIDLIRTGGHTRGHCALLMEGHLVLNHPQAEALEPVTHALYTGDAVSTRHHLRMVFHPAYDLYPMQTRAWKRNWLPKCEEHRILVLFAHDPDIYGGLLAAAERLEFRLQETLDITQ